MVTKAGAQPSPCRCTEKTANDLSRTLILSIAHLHLGRHNGKYLYHFGILTGVHLPLAVDVRRGISSRLGAGGQAKYGHSSKDVSRIQKHVSLRNFLHYGDNKIHNWNYLAIRLPSGVESFQSVLGCVVK